MENVLTIQSVQIRPYARKKVGTDAAGNIITEVCKLNDPDADSISTIAVVIFKNGTSLVRNLQMFQSDCQAAGLKTELIVAQMALIGCQIDVSGLETEINDDNRVSYDTRGVKSIHIILSEKIADKIMEKKLQTDYSNWDSAAITEFEMNSNFTERAEVKQRKINFVSRFRNSDLTKNQASENTEPDKTNKISKKGADIIAAALSGTEK